MLKNLIPVFVDVETFMKKPTITLGTMTLRTYLAASHYLSIAVAVGDKDVRVYEADSEGKLPEEVEVELQGYARDPAYVFVAHNAAFDIRVLRAYSAVPFPRNVWCTWEGAMGAWPELPGGYSLKKLTTNLVAPMELRKLDIDLETCTREELLTYNKVDVAGMRWLYNLQIQRIPEIEQAVALRTHQQRQFHFRVTNEKLNALLKAMEDNAGAAEKKAGEMLSEEDMEEVFNHEDGPLFSIRSARLLKILNEKFAFDTDTTSLKKISPMSLAHNKPAADLLKQTSLAAKMISHKRRAKVFTGITEVDVELGYMRAHTGRFSSPSTGKGLNLHNMAKHDKMVAKPVREMFRLDEDLCFVRADLANVEYRVEGVLTNCATVFKTFDTKLGGSPFNDPYVAAWESMTRQKISKKDPLRQIAKAAVLGLGFGMGPPKFANSSLLPGIAKAKETGEGVTEEDLSKMAIELNWKDPYGDGLKRIIQDAQCSKAVARAAYHIHRAFNESHPEFRNTADWLLRAITAVASAGSKSKAKDILKAYNESTSAPETGLIQMEVDDDPLFSRPSIRIACGPWVRTVCWREPKMRVTSLSKDNNDYRITILKANGEPKVVTRQLLIENVVQAAARNGLCWCVAELERRGFPHVLHIHDEMLIICKRERNEVIRARDALIETVKSNPMGWAVFIDENEISVTESLWEEMAEIKGRWEKIMANTSDCLSNLC